VARRNHASHDAPDGVEVGGVYEWIGAEIDESERQRRIEPVLTKCDFRSLTELCSDSTVTFCGGFVVGL